MIRSDGILGMDVPEVDILDSALRSPCLHCMSRQGAQSDSVSDLPGSLQQMEMRGTASADAGVRPIGHDLGIHYHFIVKPDERNVGEFLEEVVANHPGQTLPLFRIHRIFEGEIV